MNKALKYSVLMSVFASMAACGSQSKKKESSETSGFFSSDELNFNLGSYLARYEGRNLPDYLNYSSDGISTGDKRSFLVTTNFVYKSEVQKVSAQLYLDAIAMEANIADGHLIDLIVSAQTDTPKAYYAFRVNGDDKNAQEITSEQKLEYVRSLGAQIPFAIPFLPGLGINLGGKVGTSGSLTITPKFDIENRTAEIGLKPNLALVGEIKTSVTALFAEAGAEGKVKVFNGSMPISGGVKALDSGDVKPILRVKPIKLEICDGEANLFANLSIGNVLPGPAKKLWKVIFGKGWDYEHSLIRWDGYEYQLTEGYDLSSN